MANKAVLTVRIPRNAVLPSISRDALQYAGERQRERIIQRTLSGVDYLGKPFAPYSERGPYYYYPLGASSSKASRKRAASRLYKKLSKNKLSKNKRNGVRLTRSGIGIRFASYGAFKRALGRGNVDLFGIRAPHMLQSLVVQVRSNRQLIIGIYDPEKAKVAQGHMRGIRGRLPKREFLGISPDDRRLIARDVIAKSR